MTLMSSHVLDKGTTVAFVNMTMLDKGDQEAAIELLEECGYVYDDLSPLSKTGCAIFYIKGGQGLNWFLNDMGRI